MDGQLRRWTDTFNLLRNPRVRYISRVAVAQDQDANEYTTDFISLYDFRCTCLQTIWYRSNRAQLPQLRQLYAVLGCVVMLAAISSHKCGCTLCPYVSTLLCDQAGISAFPLYQQYALQRMEPTFCIATTFSQQHSLSQYICWFWTLKFGGLPEIF